MACKKCRITSRVLVACSLALGGSDSLYAVTVAPKGFLTTVRKITVVGKNKPLRTKALFKLPTGYGSVVHLR